MSKSDATQKVNEAQGTIDRLVSERGEVERLIRELESRAGAVDLSGGAMAALAAAAADNAQLESARAILPAIDAAISAARDNLLVAKAAITEAALAGLRKAETEHERRILAALENLAGEIDAFWVTAVKIIEVGGKPHARIMPFVRDVPAILEGQRNALRRVNHTDQKALVS